MMTDGNYTRGKQNIMYRLVKSLLYARNYFNMCVDHISIKNGNNPPCLFFFLSEQTIRKITKWHS